MNNERTGRVDRGVPAEPVRSSDSVAFAKALADETRQQIMEQLCCVWRNVGEIVEALEDKVNQPTVSHHLRVLRDAGLVHVRQKGRQRFYTLNQERLTVCCGQLIVAFAPDVAGQVLRAVPPRAAGSATLRSGPRMAAASPLCSGPRMTAASPLRSDLDIGAISCNLEEHI